MSKKAGNDPGLILDCERTQNENDSIIRWGGHLYNVWQFAGRSESTSIVFSDLAEQFGYESRGKNVCHGPDWKENHKHKITETHYFLKFFINIILINTALIKIILTIIIIFIATFFRCCRYSASFLPSWRWSTVSCSLSFLWTRDSLLWY